MRQASDLKCAGEESSGRETIGPSKDRGCVTEGVRPTTTHRTSYYYQCSSSTTFSTSTRPAMSNLSSTSSSVTATPSNVKATQSYPSQPPGTPTGKSPSRIPVTPAVLRSIFASSRTTLEERSLSRVAFFRFTGFLLSCVAISLAAARGRGIKSGAALLGVGVV